MHNQFSPKKDMNCVDLSKPKSTGYPSFINTSFGKTEVRASTQAGQLGGIRMVGRQNGKGILNEQSRNHAEMV